MRTLQTDRERAAAIAAATLTDGGATFVLTADAFLTSVTVPTFVVGVGAWSREVPAQAFGANDVRLQLSRARIVRADGVGTWTHNGSVYVDLVEIFTDREEALAAARERGELAIWDALAGAEISTGIAA